MTQDNPAAPVPADPAPLSAEEIARRADNLVRLIETHGCTDLAIRAAEAIADNRGGGHVLNVVNMLPQTVVTEQDGKRHFDDRFDLNGNGTLEKHELTAVVLAAATIAARQQAAATVEARHDIKVSDVPVDDKFLQVAREKCTQVQQGSTGVCR